MSKIGIIAGNRTFPIHVALAAKALGYEVVAVGLKEETETALEQAVDRMHWVTLGQIHQVPDLLKREGIRELILAGQIRPERLLKEESRFDGVVKQLFQLLPDRSGNSAMKLAVRFLESEGFKVLDSGIFLKDWLPAAGVLTRRSPTSEEQQDVAFGLELARQLARLGVGQMVVVRRGAVVAVEAIEGTDAAVRRAGQVAGRGCVVAKSCEPGHDMRFDIPVVGKETIQAMREAEATCLGVAAKRTLLFEYPDLIAQADRESIAIVAV